MSFYQISSPYQDSMKTYTSTDYLVATDSNVSVFVRRSDVTRYTDLVASLLGFFPGMNAQSIVIQTNEMDVCAGRYVDIPPDLWPEISPQIRNLKVISRPTQKRSTTPQPMIIHVQIPSGETKSVSLPRSASVNDLKIVIQDTEGTPIYRQLLTCQGQSLMDDSKLSEYSISDKATIQLQQNEAMISGSLPCLGRGRGMRKPVIYLFSPRPIHSIVRVSLVKAWSFSTVYPDVPIKDTELGQSIVWDVDTHEDHSLTTTTGNRVSYLFWEAEPKPHVLPSPLSSPRDTIIPFDPLFPQITRENSVVLRSSTVAAYLDKVLSSLCLHIEARTSFITHWLPSLLKHEYVALDFLPQASYEYAAPLDVDPKPGIITRVFMLFTRVCEDELGEWEGALSRASENADFWESIVGVDSDKMKDERLFRVLEWGGMEVAC
ncbi:uncharacterized protein ARMOST_18171 [Armillaria ostoyae]|uniref:Ubiquitin-like domain-containing protein n=1 Tax=Armillaria ostoyae TaxID=47428 RepID=A0A284S116_ARMOS|nr:uncharacterized protein ARMOST_18171 [Armillaria ostoyae]